jgi:hypothetical protein
LAESAPTAANPTESFEEENRRLPRENAGLREDREILKNRGVLCQGISMRYAFIEGV